MLTDVALEGGGISSGGVGAPLGRLAVPLVQDLVRLWSGGGRCAFQSEVLANGAIIIDINHTPGAGDAAAAGGVEVGALGEVELDGVDDADGEGVGLGIEGGDFVLLGVGVELGGLGGGAFGDGIGVDGGDLGGAGEGHGDVGGSFGGGARGLPSGDLGTGLENGGVGAEVGQGTGGEVAPVMGAAGGGEDAASDAEVVNLVEMADVEGEPVDGDGHGAGSGSLGGEGGLDVAGFLEEAVEETGGRGFIELSPMGGANEAVSGELLPGFARGGECAEDGGLGIGEAAGWHGGWYV